MPMNMMNKPKVNKVDQIIEARKQILGLPKDRMVSNIQAPSAFTTIPSRALSDKLILSHPSSLQVLCVLCSYVDGVSGIAFPNQLTMAQRLNRTQQAVSRQLMLLVKWGYIKKIVKENALRVYGRKGATWRILYDPLITDEDIIMTTNDPRVEENKAQITIKQMVKEEEKEQVKAQIKLSEKQAKMVEGITQRYLKGETEYFPYDTIYKAISTYLGGEQSIEAWNKLGTGLLSPIEKGFLKPNSAVSTVFNSQRPEVVKGNGVIQHPEVVKQVYAHSSNTTLEVVQEGQISQHTEVVRNLDSINYNSSILEKSKEMVKRYAELLDEIMTTRGSWRWDMRQEAMAEDIARLGVTVDQFTETVRRVLMHKRKEGIQPPYTLSYFKSVFTEDKQPGNVKDITKALAKSFKL